MLCVWCVVGCVSYYSVVPALKSISNWACCDFLMEISAACANVAFRFNFNYRINVINNHQVPF
jgi:hypothetical protein